MTSMTILLVAAAIAFGLSKWMHLPVIPLLMLAGVGLRMLADAGGIDVPAELLSEMVELGLAVLVFTAGAELSPRRMRGRTHRHRRRLAILPPRTRRCADRTSLGHDLMTAFYLGCALSASSTLVVVRHSKTAPDVSLRTPRSRRATPSGRFHHFDHGRFGKIARWFSGEFTGSHSSNRPRSRGLRSPSLARAFGNTPHKIGRRRAHACRVDGAFSFPEWRGC